MKFTFNDKTLEISSPDNSFIMPTSSGEVSPEGALLPSTGNITILGPKDAVELGSTTQLFHSVCASYMYSYDYRELSDRRYKTNIVDLMPGIYLYSLIADGQVVDTHRMVVTE